MFIDKNRVSFFALLGGLWLLPVASASGQTAAVTNADQIVSKVDEYMSAAERIDRFSGTILIARNGKPIVSKGYSMANREWDISNSPKTAFRFGSITKQFTSAAIMLLQERGKLSVSDPVCKYVADCPVAWEPITIRHLLTDTSGIPIICSGRSSRRLRANRTRIFCKRTYSRRSG